MNKRKERIKHGGSDYGMVTWSAIFKFFEGAPAVVESPGFSLILALVFRNYQYYLTLNLKLRFSRH